MSLLEKIRMRKTDTTSPPPAPSAALPAAPTLDPAAVAEEAAKLAAEEAALRSASVTPPDAPEPTPPKAEIIYNGAKLAELDPPKLETIEPLKKPRKPRVEKADAPAPVAEGLTLYLDCCEDGVATKRLEAYAQTLADELAKAAGAADIRCAPKDSALGYGGYKGALAATARAAPPEPGAYEVSVASELGMLVFEALAPTARVIRKR